MKSSIISKLNIATWCVAILAALMPVVHGNPAEQAVGSAIATLFWMAVYYLFSLVIAPKLLLQKKLVLFFSVSFAIVLVLPFIGYTLLLLSGAVFRGSFENFYSAYSLPMHFSGFKAMALAGVYGSFFRLIDEYFKS